MAMLLGSEIDWFRDISAKEETGENFGRVYVRFRLNRADTEAKARPTSDRLVMLRNAYPEAAEELLYPNAVVVTEGAYVTAEIVVRARTYDVGCGFSFRMGVPPGPIKAETRPIADKLYSVGPASTGPDGAAAWWADSVRRYQGEAKLISFSSLADLASGNRTTEQHASVIPRSRCDIHAWPVAAYNDLDEGEAYSDEYRPSGSGPSPFGKSSSDKPASLAAIDRGDKLPGAAAVDGAGTLSFRSIEIQKEKLADRLGSFSVQFFVFQGNEAPSQAGKLLSMKARLAAACPRGKPD